MPTENDIAKVQMWLAKAPFDDPSALAAQPNFSYEVFAQSHGFATDPQLPWVSATLNNPVVSDPNKRIERLYSKTMTYLRHVLTSLEKA
jgi:hypothetical protein